MARSGGRTAPPSATRGSVFAQSCRHSSAAGQAGRLHCPGFRIEWRFVQTPPIHPATRTTRVMTPTAMRPIRSVYSVSGAPRSSRQRRVSSFFRLTPSKGISSCCPSRSPPKPVSLPAPRPLTHQAAIYIVCRMDTTSPLMASACRPTRDKVRPENSGHMPPRRLQGNPASDPNSVGSAWNQFDRHLPAVNVWLLMLLRNRVDAATPHCRLLVPDPMQFLTMHWTWPLRNSRLSAEAHCLSFWARGSIAGRLACCEWLRRKSPGSEALGGNLDVSAGWGLGHSNAAEASGPSQHGPRTWRLAPWAPKITTRRSRSQACDSRSQWHHCRADLLVPARPS